MDYLVIHIDEERVTAARFAVSGKWWSFSGAEGYPTAGELTLAEIAARVAADRIKTPRVIICLPAARFAQRTLELPLESLRKVREVLPAQLQADMALPAGEVVFDALPLAPGRFLALWTCKAWVAEAIDIFRAAGCEPHLVSSAPFGWTFLPGCPTDAVLCDGRVLSVVSAGRLSFIRTLDADDPRQGIKATLAALESQGSALPPGVVLFGPEAPALAAGGDFGLPVETLTAPQSMVGQFASQEDFLRLAGPLAVARACHAGELPDFRRGELACTSGDALLRRRALVSAGLAAVAVVLLFVSLGLKYFQACDDLAAVDRCIAATYREIFPKRAKAVDEVAEVKGEIRKLAGMQAGSAALDLLRTLAQAQGSSINGLYEVDLDGCNLRMKGDAASAQLVNTFKASLASLLPDTQLGEVKSRPDGTVTFTMVAGNQSAGSQGRGNQVAGSREANK